MNDNELVRKRLTELAEKSFRGNCFTFSDFLGLMEMAEYYSIEKTLGYAHPVIFGGYDGFERAVVRFGNPDELGYEENWPIVLVKISPAAEKFADDLGHRDFLGALMNQGIERSVLGDIVINGKCAYLFCLEKIAAYLCENLVSVRHTTVHAEIIPFEAFEQTKSNEVTEKRIQVQSERLDAVAAHVMNISRSAVLEYFRQQKVFVNGRLTENTSYMLKNDDVVTVRGFGRFTFAGTEGVSRKGKLNVLVRL